MRKAFLAILLVCLIPFSSMITCMGENAENPANDYFTTEDYENSYQKYISENNSALAENSIEIDGNAYVSADGKHESSEESSEIFYEDSSATYEIYTDKEGLYEIGVSYLLVDSGENDGELSLLINGKVPFDEAENIKLPRYWVDDGGLREDSLGNQTAPMQKQENAVRTEMFKDKSGTVTENLKFHLSVGKNTVTLQFKNSDARIYKLYASAPYIAPSYKELNAGYTDTKTDAEPIVIEAESAYAKSSRSIIGKSDTNSSNVSPSDAVRQKINYIGSSNWQKPNETIEWQLNVETAGYYKIGFVYKQNGVLNGQVYRKLEIDGKSPFVEAENLSFDYCRDWSFYEVGDDENSYLIYLDAGEHILSLSVTMGSSAPIYERLNSVTSTLRELYMNIIMITGETPDSNRDYDLYEQIPNFEKIIQDSYDELYNIVDLMRETTGQKTNTQISTIINTARTLKNMLDNIYRAEDYLSDYYNNYSSLCSSLSDMRILPLSLDRIIVSASERGYSYEKKGFFERFSFGLRRFVLSFGEDYNSLSTSVAGDEEIKLWVNWGRDQAMSLNNLIETTFTPETNIKVNLQITSASIINGMLSGNAPDLSLSCSRSDPVNFAMRGAVYDLSKFDDFDEVMKRFSQTADVPYTYNGGVYALPSTQSFYIMYYRSDILEKLGIAVPETWDDFLSAATILQMNNMEAWVSYTAISDTGTVNAGLGGLNLYASILSQYGGTVYNDEHTATAFLTPTSLAAFSFWSDIYVKYKFPVSISFYNRFRVGITPLGIDTYTIYSQIKELAPEIDGKWGIALIPGTPKSDGTVDHTVSAGGGGCIILQNSEHKEAAWEFLKWWTSADTQLLYNNEIESLLGTISRTTTANMEAFERMSWDADDLKVLKEQRSYIKEVPEIPGSYYATRAIDQAFWAVYNKGENVKDALMKWSDLADNEIERKIAEYSR